MALFSMDVNNLRDLYIDQLRDLYDAENQIIDALPKLIEKSSNPELKNALQQHLDVTRTQAQRIERICSSLDIKPKGESCKGMKGVIKEGDDLVSKGNSSGVIDASIIASAQRVEHYEMAGYGTARTYAQQLGRTQDAQLLEQTLNEEKEADKLLSQIASTVNIEAKAA
jgi:ferritin-like metal-binding protein YciE